MLYRNEDCFSPNEPCSGEMNTLVISSSSLSSAKLTRYMYELVSGIWYLVNKFWHMVSVLKGVPGYQHLSILHAYGPLWKEHLNIRHCSNKAEFYFGKSLSLFSIEKKKAHLTLFLHLRWGGEKDSLGTSYSVANANPIFFVTGNILNFLLRESCQLESGKIAF